VVFAYSRRPPDQQRRPRRGAHRGLRLLHLARN
jgi:hypothetical protein